MVPVINKPTMPKSTGITDIFYDEFVVSETDKSLFFKNILKEDEIAIVGENKDFIFSFNDRIPEIVSNIFGMKIQRPKSEDPDELIDIEELKKAVNADSFGNILMGRDCAATINVRWPQYCDLQQPYDNIKISSFPTSRKIPIIFYNSKREDVVDLLPVVKAYHKFITTDELVQRLLKVYKEECEKLF